jgi:hypothetical protein
MDGRIVIFALLVVIVILEVLRSIERKELCDRLMCRDLADYKRWGATETDVTRKTAHEKAIEKWRSGQ